MSNSRTIATLSHQTSDETARESAPKALTLDMAYLASQKPIEPVHGSGLLALEQKGFHHGVDLVCKPQMQIVLSVFEDVHPGTCRW
eukprot:6173537-Pleurochrysis_carterae.AAC.1